MLDWNVDIPETFSCCAVKLVALVTPSVEIPEELMFVKVALVLFNLVIVPTPALTWPLNVVAVTTPLALMFLTTAKSFSVN